MNIRKRLPALLAALALCGGSAAQAAPFNEIGDAGQLLGTAQVLGANVTSIAGTITPSGNADLYRFEHGGGAFGATTVGTPGSLGDTQLFLFSASGSGITGNDDTGATLRAAISLADLAPGVYFLGVSGFDTDPVDIADLELFTDNFPGVQNPIGGRGPLDDWLGGSATGTYTIELRQATVPLPGSLPLVALAFGAFALSRRRT